MIMITDNIMNDLETPPPPPPGPTTRRIMEGVGIIPSVIPPVPIKSYVYEDQEVIKTGRCASKQLASGKVDILYEITPNTSLDNKWKKWVRDVDLYLIQGSK